MRIPAFIASGLLSCLVLFAPAAVAASASQIQQLRDSSYRVTTQMFMYAILNRAKERQQDARSRIAAIDTQVASLGDAEVAKRWQAVRSSLQGELYVDGDVNQRTLYSIEDSTTLFGRELDRLMPRELGREEKALYDLAQRMQVMMLIYLRNSADPLGGSNYSGVNNEVDLEQLPDAFDAELKTLAKTHPKLAPVFTKIRPKWVFLAPRLRDFNQKTVPYLVDMYGRQIIDTLLAAAREQAAAAPAG